MFVKGGGCGFIISFHGGLCFDALLLPEKWHTATNLDERIHEVTIDKDLLCLNKVSNVAIIVKTAGQIPGTSHSMPPTRYQQHLELLSIKYARLIFDVALYNWHDPFVINFLIGEILTNVIVPEVSFVARIPNILLTTEALISNTSHSLTV